MQVFALRIRAAVIALCLGFGVLAGQPAFAQQGVMRIAAIVNDDLISVYDLQNRVRWVVLSSGIRPDQSNQRRVVQQVLRDLVAERLRLQEAERLSIRVTDREIDRQIQVLADRQNTDVGGFLERVSQRGIDPATVRAQARANIAWNKLATRQLRRQVNVGEDEIDLELEKLRSALNLPQKRLQEVFLSFDSEGNEAETFQAAERIVQQAREGSDFSSLARAFSQSRTAQEGGDLGWLTEAQLGPELLDAFRSLRPGDTSDPIRTPSGIAILHVSGQRAGGVSVQDAQLDLYQIALPVQQNATPAQAAAAAGLLNEIRPAIASCETAREIAGQLQDATAAGANGVRLGDMPENLQSALAALQAGETSEPVRTPRAVLIVTICARDDAGAALPSRADILNRIGTERMELLARRYMRDLRREAFIDIRL